MVGSTSQQVTWRPARGVDGSAEVGDSRVIAAAAEGKLMLLTAPVTRRGGGEGQHPEKAAG